MLQCVATDHRADFREILSTDSISCSKLCCSVLQCVATDYRADFREIHGHCITETSSKLTYSM